MKTRLGIVGPHDSVKLISDLANDFSERIIIVPIIYTHLDDVPEIIIKWEDQVDIWLFSGQVPYAIAYKSKKLQNSFYPRLNGSSLTKVLLDICYKDNKNLLNLSFDTISSEEVFETFTELDLPTEHLRVNSYSGYKPVQELVDYHANLYSSGEVDSCITCIHSVFKRLKSIGIPTYRITPTKMVIRETIEQACQTNETIRFKNSQISVILIQIHEMNKLIGENDVSYNAHRLNLKLQELVINFTEMLSGSYAQLGPGKFMIFSTRGSFETQNQSEISTLLEKISIITGLTANIGIGYGNTALGAEQNAYLALNHSKNHGENIAMLVDEGGRIEGPLQNENSLDYSYRTDNKEVIEKLQNSGVNISTLNKLISIQNKFSQGVISAVDVSKWLGMTQRNARRILNELEKCELAVIVGEETPTAKGRPRKIYRVGTTNKMKS